MPIREGYGVAELFASGTGNATAPADVTAGVVIAQGERRRPGRVIASATCFGVRTFDANSNPVIDQNAAQAGYALLVIAAGQFAVTNGRADLGNGRELARIWVPHNTTQSVDLAELLARGETDAGPSEGFAAVLFVRPLPDGTYPLAARWQLACAVVPAREPDRVDRFPYGLR